MRHSDKVHLSEFSQYSDHDPFFDEDYFQDIEINDELAHYLDMTDLDEPGDIFRYEN